MVPEKPILLPAEEHTYGRRNRPQTPVNGIISHYYGEAAGRELQQRYIHKKEMVNIFETLIFHIGQAIQHWLRFNQNDECSSRHGQLDSWEVDWAASGSLDRQLQAEALHLEHRSQNQHQARWEALHEQEVNMKNFMRYVQSAEMKGDMSV